MNYDHRDLDEARWEVLSPHPRQVHHRRSFLSLQFNIRLAVCFTQPVRPRKNDVDGVPDGKDQRIWHFGSREADMFDIMCHCSTFNITLIQLARFQTLGTLAGNAMHLRAVGGALCSIFKVGEGIWLPACWWSENGGTRNISGSQLAGFQTTNKKHIWNLEECKQGHTWLADCCPPESNNTTKRFSGCQVPGAQVNQSILLAASLLATRDPSLVAS